MSKKIKPYDPFEYTVYDMADSVIMGVTEEERISAIKEHLQKQHDNILHKMLIIALVLKEGE